MKNGFGCGQLFVLFGWFPSSGSARYTQMQEARHFGMDAEIQRPGRQTLAY